MTESIVVDGNRSPEVRLQRRHMSRGEQTAGEWTPTIASLSVIKVKEALTLFYDRPSRDRDASINM